MHIEQDALLSWLDGRMQVLAADIDALEAGGRSDEANLRKAARNIYGIFAELSGKGMAMPALAAQADKLGAAWRQAAQLASVHNDHVRGTIEGEKLAALADIRAMLGAPQGENHGD